MAATARFNSKGETMSSGNRRLYFCGFVFLALAPISGLLILAPVANPRAMLSLHLALWLSGVVLCAAGAGWPLLAMGTKAKNWIERGLISGMWIGLVLACMPAFLGTATLFAGAGAAPPSWAKVLEKVLQIGFTATLTPALLGMAVGLGKRATA
jgi:hypothetical protein